MLRRRNSAERRGWNSQEERRSSQDSSTSIDSAETRRRLTDTRFPKHLVERRGKRTALHRSMAGSYLLEGYIEQEEETFEKKIVKRLPRIKILSDFMEFMPNQGQGQHPSPQHGAYSSRSFHSNNADEDGECAASDEGLSRVDEDAALEQDEKVKIRRAKCKVMTDRDEFNTGTSVDLFKQNFQVSKPPEDIAEVVEVDDREVAKAATPRLRVDELDSDPKKNVVECFMEIEEQKNDDEDPKPIKQNSESAFIRKIILSQSETISEEDEARQTFERQISHPNSCLQISEDINEELNSEF